MTTFGSRDIVERVRSASGSWRGPAAMKIASGDRSQFRNLDTKQVEIVMIMLQRPHWEGSTSLRVTHCPRQLEHSARS